jgi:hypothetical protein
MNLWTQSELRDRKIHRLRRILGLVSLAGWTWFAILILAKLHGYVALFALLGPLGSLAWGLSFAGMPTTAERRDQLKGLIARGVLAELELRNMEADKE